MAIEIVNLAIKNGGTFHINHHFPMDFPCFPIKYCHFPSFFVGFPEGTIGGSQRICQNPRFKVLRRPQLLQPHSAISQKKRALAFYFADIIMCIYNMYTVYTYHYINISLYIYINHVSLKERHPQLFLWSTDRCSAIMEDLPTVGSPLGRRTRATKPTATLLPGRAKFSKHGERSASWTCCPKKHGKHGEKPTETTDI
jgi:hypothetical protein